MMKLSLPADKQFWRKDLTASLIVFLVSLPLNLGIALGAGAPPIWGIISAIIAGIVVGAITGSPLRVSGPADSGMAFVAAINAKLGLGPLGVIVFMAGAIQFVAGRLKLGQWFRAVPPSVVRGMLSGIGVLIVASQLHALIDTKPAHSAIANLMSMPQIIASLNASENHNHLMALGLGLVTLAIYIVWEQPWIPKLLKRVPGSLIAVLVGTVLGLALNLPVKYVTFPDNLLQGAPFGQLFHQWGYLKDPQVWSFILGLSLVLSAETLLDAIAVDKLVAGHKTKYNWDLSSQGIGNMLCGVAGTMPISGVIVRSVTNVKSGAQTRLACVFLGVWLLIAITAGKDLLSHIPMTSLSAVLLYVGFKLMDLKAFKEMADLGRGELVIFTITLATVVVHEILTGVLVGLLLAVVRLVVRFSRLSIKVLDGEHENEKHIYLKGAATFIRLPFLADVLDTMPPQAHVHLHINDVTYFDHACIELIEDWERVHQLQGGQISIDWDTLFKRPTRSAPPQTESNLPTHAPSAVLSHIS